MRLAAVVVVVAAALMAARPAPAASPRLILVSGPGLTRPVLLADWGENGVLLSALVPARPAERAAARGLAKRPRFDLALFWVTAAIARPVRPTDATQHGWFYPARGPRPAIVDLQVRGVRIPRVAPPRFLRILARHGVPTRV